MMTRHRGHWTPADRAEAIYRYLPFDVPRDAEGLTVTLRYDHDVGVLDMGLFDPHRFRGWSGSERDRVTVAADAATPGYLPGELPAGTWSLLLSLHRVPVDGLPFDVTVEMGPATHETPPSPLPRPERPPGRDIPASAGRRWLAGDLHAHSVHSDGSLTIDELASMSRSRGLDFLAVTDHNTTSHHSELAAPSDRLGIILVPGQEVTTDEGHANCFGDTGWIDFRRPADEWLEGAEASGGLLSVNHPLAGDCRWRKPMRRRPPLAEVWHSSWDRGALLPIAWWAGWGEGHAIGGSDFHRFGDAALPGQPTTWLETEDEDVV
ncbi:MAG: CehA/McbA family metallohydrolase, partial [Chloroflexota bacterium]